jgi:hypothetical protein
MAISRLRMCANLNVPCSTPDNKLIGPDTVQVARHGGRRGRLPMKKNDVS